MITLIGGFSCSGKSYLAHRLMKDVAIPYFSIDYLKMGIYRSNKNCGYTPTDPDEDIAHILWPIIREMIYTYIENEQDMIIEGAYILPEFYELINDEYKKNVNMVFIGFSKEYIDKNFESHILGHKDAIEKRYYEDDRPKELFINGHLDLKLRAEKAGLDFYQIGESYMEDTKEIMRLINSKMDI